MLKLSIVGYTMFKGSNTEIKFPATMYDSSQMIKSETHNSSHISTSTLTKYTAHEIKTTVVRKVDSRNRHKESTIVSPKCARCKNHGVICPLKGHKGLCKWKDCTCKNCSLIIQRQRIMAAEQSVLKEMAEHKRESSNGLEISTSSSTLHGKLILSY